MKYKKGDCMYSLLSIILLLCLWNSILFFNQSLGINVILFTIPMCLFLIYVFKNKQLIKNKKGLLYVIPITLLSLSYFIYDNEIFNILNRLVITLLYIFMFIYTINPTYKICNIISNIFSIIFEPFGKIDNVFRLIKSNKKEKSHNKNIGKLLKSIIIILPIVLFIIYLLSSADEVFRIFFNDIFEWIKNLTLERIIFELISRGIIIFILFTYISSILNYIIFNYKNVNNSPKVINKEYDTTTIKMLLTILNVIYIFFDIIQIRSLLLHKMTMDITYSEYARRGFFELLVVSLLNLIFILIAKKQENKNDSTYIKTNSIIMVFLTLIIIASSFIRMYMYQDAYGCTFLRLMTYVVLITEVLMLIPTIMYILDSKVKILRYYIPIAVFMYTLVNLLPINGYITKYNIDRYYKTGKLDIEYLKNNSADNIEELINLYNKTDDENIKEELYVYLTNKDNFKTRYSYFSYKTYRSYNDKKINIQEFNISKFRAHNKLVKNNFR